MEENTYLEIDPSDIERNKVMAILAYILFFIPLLAAKDSKFAVYHANQGLILFLAAFIINVVGTVIPLVGWLVVIPLGNLAVLIWAILGIIKAAGGKVAPLPLIGKYSLLKVK